MSLIPLKRKGPFPLVSQLTGLFCTALRMYTQSVLSYEIFSFKTETLTAAQEEFPVMETHSC